MMEHIKVLLLNPPSRHGVALVRDTLYGCWCKGRASYNWPPIALATLGAVLKNADLDVALIDAMGLGQNFYTTIDEVKKIHPKYLIVNTATISFSSDVDFIKEIKKSFPNLITILIGTHVTVMPSATLKEPALDYLILGEPDFVLRDLILELESDNPDLHKIKGLAFRDNGKIISTGIADPIENLDSIPFPDRSLIPNAKYFNPLAKKLPYTSIFSSRGCPAMCTFCTSVILYGKKFRGRSAKNVVDEMELCKTKYGIKEIFFRDETFTLDKARTIEICKDIISRKLNMTWIVNSRVNSIDEETVSWMKKAGCHMIKFGVESGSQEVLNKLKKGITLDQTREAFALCKKFDISSVAHLMFGAPGETEDTLKQTLNFVLELNPDFASFNITTPYPGTEMWNEFVKDKVSLSKDFSAYDIEKTLETSNFSEMLCDISPEKLNSFYDKTYRKFYFRPSYILRRLLKSSIRDYARLTKAGISLVSFNIKTSLLHRKTKK